MALCQLCYALRYTKTEVTAYIFMYRMSQKISQLNTIEFTAFMIFLIESVIVFIRNKYH